MSEKDEFALEEFLPYLLNQAAEAASHPAIDGLSEEEAAIAAHVSHFAVKAASQLKNRMAIAL